MNTINVLLKQLIFYNGRITFTWFDTWILFLLKVMCVYYTHSGYMDYLWKHYHFIKLDFYRFLRFPYTDMR